MSARVLVKTELSGLPAKAGAAGVRPVEMRSVEIRLAVAARASRLLALVFATGLASSFAIPALAFDVTRGEGAAVRPVSAWRDAQQALQAGIESLRSGNTRSSVDALTYAAQGGETLARWKLGKMYANGDGVVADDWKAYQYFLAIVQSYDEDAAPQRDMPAVTSAFVAVGVYNLNGIPEQRMPANPARAQQMFQYAATNFGDPNAQYNLARIYLDGAGVPKDARQAARWLRLAADKAHAPSQALLGHLLFNGADGIARQRARGLMFLTLARESALDPAKDQWIIDLYEKAMATASESDRQAALASLEGWLKKRD